MKFILSAVTAIALSSVAAGAATLNLDDGQTEGVDALLVAEKTSVSVGADEVTVDYLLGSNLAVGGTVLGVNTFSSGFSLASGSYDSHLIHFDPLNNSGATTSGSFDFVGDIVALIVSNNGTSQLLNLSDAVFAAAGVTYENEVHRRSEGPDPNGDSFTLVDANTLTYNFKTTSRFIDNVRVITEVAPVPVPAALPLLLVGLGGLAMLKKRRKS